MGHLKRRESGQAAVETAIVMPLFVFILMGLIQLGLAHQARLMTRYAAYKATRAGAIHRAKKSVMTNAALAVLVPMIPGDDGRIKPPRSAGDYDSGWSSAKSNRYSDGPEIVKTTICNPLSGNMSETSDFDDPQVASGGEWMGFRRSRLHVQVTFYYQLLIPFANAMLFWTTAGIESQHRETFNTFRLRDRNSSDSSNKWSSDSAGLKGFAERGKYYLPINANYAMRMQSNVAAGALPGRNECWVNFKVEGSNSSQRVVESHSTGAGP